MRFERKMIMEPRPHCFYCKLPLDISRNDTKHNAIYFDKRFYHKDCFLKLKNTEVKKKCYCCEKDINVEHTDENVLFYKKHYYHKECFEQWCKDTKRPSTVRMTALENIDLYIKAANDNISALANKKEEQLNSIRLLENDASNRIKRWFDESDLCSFIRAAYGIKNIPWRRLSQVLEGTDPKLGEPIPADDLLDMWIRKWNFIKKQNEKIKSNSTQPVTIDNLISYDLSILISKYDSYLKWKREQQIIAAESLKTENNVLAREMVNIASSVKPQNNNNDNDGANNNIEDLVDDIFG